MEAREVSVSGATQALRAARAAAAAPGRPAALSCARPRCAGPSPPRAPVRAWTLPVSTEAVAEGPRGRRRPGHCLPARLRPVGGCWASRRSCAGMDEARQRSKALDWRLAGLAGRTRGRAPRSRMNDDLGQLLVWSFRMMNGDSREAAGAKQGKGGGERAAHGKPRRRAAAAARKDAHSTPGARGTTAATTTHPNRRRHHHQAAQTCSLHSWSSPAGLPRARGGAQLARRRAARVSALTHRAQQRGAAPRGFNLQLPRPPRHSFYNLSACLSQAQRCRPSRQHAGAASARSPRPALARIGSPAPPRQRPGCQERL